jgi:CsoR family transcriptional regulator, copper-sensing transcriptional repressor
VTSPGAGAVSGNAGSSASGTADSAGSGNGTSAAERVACGCGVSAGAENKARQALAVDPGIKSGNLTRLRRIEGQVRGLQRMVDEDRYCADIMTQLSSVQEALRAVGRELMRNHLKHCATAAIRAGDEQADSMYDELIELMYRNTR